MAKQTDIFSVFGLVDEHAEKKKREEEERRKKAEELRKKAREAAEATKAQVEEKSEKTKKKKPEPDKFEINEQTVIRYYGESIEITSYFTPEELAEGLLIKKKGGETERKRLEPEMLRKRMEKDFPELVKDHTEIIFLKKKNMVVPAMKAKKKGNCEEASSTDGASCAFPKIPFHLLRDFIALAQLYGEESLELHADIYYNTQEGTFFMDIPKQMVHRIWAEVIEESQETMERVEDAVKILEIHSHHHMKPVPSWQDDKSERIPGMIYAIVGHTQKFLPDIYVRQFISKDQGHVQILANNVFENPFERLPEFDMDAIEVTVR